MAATPYLVSSSKRSLRCRSRKPSLRKRCSSMAKQQKTRFYILGRCVSMLLHGFDKAGSQASIVIKVSGEKKKKKKK
ncbi:hypothetical protein Godav_016682 [Gossypium davidsonii]|uniref:Uncharacterized protein n=2 Tax=Gossypium TaxID=3633 RepID=A0A7J8QR06_GOSDV|nr:hypothetical protein [Gossypium davidsonii]MBA0638855.1 hypothetical protein [Gossypium klotzschianum]